MEASLDTAFQSATWIQELFHLNRVERYCTYERPGYGLSDSAPAPISIAMVADALSYALIEEAKIKGPFTTVGYDIGGLFTQVFTAKNLDKVDSMLLVESWHEDILLKNYLQRLLPPDKDSKDPDDISKLASCGNKKAQWFCAVVAGFMVNLGHQVTNILVASSPWFEGKNPWT